MFPGKESFVQLEELAQKQTRIYPDACDVGIRVDEVELRNRIRQACKELAVIYKNQAERWNFGSKWSCFIPFEMEGREYIGVTLTVTFNEDRTRKVKFFHIDIQRSRQEEDPFKECKSD